MHSGICLEEEEDDEGGNIIQLGLHVTMHYQWLAIDWLMKKWIDFVKIKFHLNENIEWHCMQLGLNWIKILDSWI